MPMTKRRSTRVFGKKLFGGYTAIERLTEGANINGKAPHGESALEYAIRFGRYGAALRLIQLGANPNAEDDSGLSPLLRSASDCNGSRVVEALLRAGANVNHHDLYGRTALINAAHADWPNHCSHPLESKGGSRH